MVKEAQTEQGSFGSAAHFALHTIQIMWAEKKLLLSLLVFPWVFPLIFIKILSYFFPSLAVFVPISDTISLSTADIALAITQPFWAITWIRYLFYPKEKPTLKSYFTINTFYWYFLGCSFLIQFLNIPMEYIEDLDVFNDMALLGLRILSLVLILPLNLTFPAIASRKVFPLWKTWSLAKPFYTRYALSLLLIAVLFFLASTLFIYIYGLAYIIAPDVFKFLYQWWPEALVYQMMDLLVKTYLLTLPALYYKEYLLKK